MARRRKKRGRRAVSRLSPVSRSGIRVGTTMGYVGLISAAFETNSHIGGAGAITAFKEGNYATGFARYAKALNPTKSTSGKILLGGLIVSLIGKGKRLGLFTLS